MIKIVDKGIISRGKAGTAEAILCFPAVTALTNNILLATYKAGSSKDGADAQVAMCRSHDGGESWEAATYPFLSATIDGIFGTLGVVYLTELAPDRLLAAALWVDRSTYPGRPLFNAETEGCLPMSIVLSESEDTGISWSQWRVVPMPAEIGPASLTNPILKLPDGSLALSVETNKHYHDASQWYQYVVMFHSADGGQTWGAPFISGQDPTGRIFNWDQRAGVTRDGRIATYTWTYDSKTQSYLNIHRRISKDGGKRWSAPLDLGFADQAAHPAILADGKVVLAWVDRFGTQSIRARWTADIEQPFPIETETVLYEHQVAAANGVTNTGEMLETMSLWSFGLPYAEALPSGEVLVLYYAGTNQAMDICWCRLQLEA